MVAGPVQRVRKIALKQSINVSGVANMIMDKKMGQDMKTAKIVLRFQLPLMITNMTFWKPYIKRHCMIL